jgi:hypothetical protein
MAFGIRIDKRGSLSIVRGWSVSERWRGSHTLNPFDWGALPRGTRIVIEEVFGPRRLPKVFREREDGLFEVDFVRVKVTTDRGQKFQTPIFASTIDPKRQTDRAFGAFAIASDAEAVHRLSQFKARERAETALADLFASYARGEQKERQAARRRQEQEAREQELRRRAAEVGVEYEELLEGMKLWNTIRRKRYPVNRCFACGKTLTDPASIVSGVGPECIRKFPAILAAAKAKLIDIGRLRFDAERLLTRFERAGMAEMSRVIRDAVAGEQLVEQVLKD